VQLHDLSKAPGAGKTKSAKSKMLEEGRRKKVSYPQVFLKPCSSFGGEQESFSSLHHD
jgi:hypothetical protein